MRNKMNIFAFSTLFNGNEMIQGLINNNIKITGVVGFKETNRQQNISGFESPEELCINNNIQFIPIQSYGLNHENDIKTLKELEMDIGLILGWQRLIPKWLIKHFNISGVGIHGSSHGINQGRGRSPQNWALIYGYDKFNLSIFRLDEGIDSGPVIETRIVPLSLFDDIKTSHLKIGNTAVNMISNLLEKNPSPFSKTKKQNANPRYFPKREPSDGMIDWNRSVLDVYNFIRALSRPYPGAYCQLQSTKLFIWKARPFYQNLNNHRYIVPGTIIQIFKNRDLLIATIDHPILIEDYEISQPKINIFVGMVIPSSNFDDIINQIVKRHRNKFPHLPLAKDFDKYLRD